MSLLIKSILATLFLLVGLIAVLCMLTLMGKADRKISPTLLRKMHKTSGFIFFILLLFISYFCIKRWILAGDQLSTRAVFHTVLALGLFIVLGLKLLIVQFYKQFLRFAPAFGMIVFCLAFVVYGTSAGYFLLRSISTNTRPESQSPVVAASSGLQANIENGASIFKNKCSSCHYPSQEKKKIGPGLKNLLKKEKLPYSGRSATIENIKKQLMNPILTMPSFASLPEQEIADLLAYLKTL